jgi:CHAT domain-containing protein/Tfp pilus assembly protein PilF
MLCSTTARHDAALSGPIIGLIVCVLLAFGISVAQDAPANPPRKPLSHAETLYNEALALARKQTREDSLVAIQKLETAIRLFRADDNKAGQERALYAVGSFYFKLVEKQKALDSLTQSLPLARDLGDRSREGSILNEIGIVYSATGEQQKAMEYLQQALALRQATGDSGGEAATLDNIGNIYRRTGERRKALEFYLQALSLARAAKRRSSEANLLNNIGQAYVNLGERQKAFEYFEQALSLARKIGDRTREASALSHLGGLYSALGDKPMAVAYYEQSLALRRDIGDRSGEADALRSIGGVYVDTGEKQTALRYFGDALALQRAVSDRAGEAATLNSIAKIYRQSGQVQKALEYSENALTIQRTVMDRAGEASTLNRLGILYDRLGDRRKALEYFEQSLSIYRKMADPAGESSVLDNLAITYTELNQRQKALEYYETALPLARKTGNRSGEGHILTNLGYLYLNLREYHQALEYYEQALPLHRAVGDRTSEAITLNDMAISYINLGNRDQALPLLMQALGLYSKTGDVLEEASTARWLMRYWKLEGNPTLAIVFGKRAVNNYQRVRTNTEQLDEGLQKSFLRGKLPTYRELADLLISQGRMEEGQQVLDLIKSQEYSEFTGRDVSRSFAPAASAASSQKAPEPQPPGTSAATSIAPPGAPAAAQVPSPPLGMSLTPQEQKVQAEYEKAAAPITAMAQELDELSSKEATGTLTASEEKRKDELRQKVSAADRQWRQTFDDLYKQFGGNQAARRLAQDVEKETSGLRNLLGAIGTGTVALYTLVGDENYRLLLITPKVSIAYTAAIGAEELRKKVLALREALHDPRVDPRPRAQELYNILLAPAEQDLRGVDATMLLWSLDGVLRYIPMAALYDGKQYLVERYRTVVFTRASVGQLKDQRVASLRALALGVSKGDSEFSPLPSVPQELRAIVQDEAAGAHGVLPGKMLLDSSFTHTDMQKALRQGYSVVHIASHFNFQPGSETDSFLLVGDGRLSLTDIREQEYSFTGVELLTLSACDTATSSTAADGREIDGLGSLAEEKGAKAVMASLWAVADQSTSLLMQRFYERLATPGVTKAEALRQAQLSLLRGTPAAPGAAPAPPNAERGFRATSNRQALTTNAETPYAHPYFWAPFILIGNGR